MSEYKAFPKSRVFLSVFVEVLSEFQLFQPFCILIYRLDSKEKPILTGRVLFCYFKRVWVKTVKRGLRHRTNTGRTIRLFEGANPALLKFSAALSPGHAFGIEQISDGFLKKSGITIQADDGRVAGATKQTAHCSGLRVAVDAKRFLPEELFADRASLALFFGQGKKFLAGQAVQRLAAQRLAAFGAVRARSIAVAGAPVSRFKTGFIAGRKSGTASGAQNAQFVRRMRVRRMGKRRAGLALLAINAGFHHRQFGRWQLNLTSIPSKVARLSRGFTYCVRLEQDVPFWRSA